MQLRAGPDASRRGTPPVHLSIWIALLLKHRKHKNLFDLLQRAAGEAEMQLIFVAALGLDDCFRFFLHREDS